jgi:hypothetical protein
MKWAALTVVLLLAFLARIVWLGHLDFHEDEFFTMLAVKQTLQKGVPALPSGLLYHKGLAYTYLTSLLTGMVGFSAAMTRWPALVTGMLSIGTFYAAARRMSGCWWAGWFALVLSAFDSDAIAWSGRARMYAMALTLVPLLIWSVWRNAIYPERGQLLFGTLLLFGVLIHPGTAILGAALVAAVLIFGAVGGRMREMVDAISLPGLLILGTAAVLALLLTVGGNMTDLAVQTVSDAPDTTQASVDPSGLVHLVEHASDIVSFLQASHRRLLATCVALIGGVWSLWRLVISRKLHSVDHALVFLSLVFVFTVSILVLLPYPDVRRDRELFLLLLPTIYLLAGLVLYRVAFTIRNVSSLRAGGSIVYFLVSALWLLPLPRLTWTEAGKARYDLAYEFISPRLEDDDIVMAVRTAPCGLFLGDCDFYLSEIGVRATDMFSHEYTDWYIGAPWVADEHTFNSLLDSEAHAWLVVRDSQLAGNFTPSFIQDIYTQMTVQHRASDVLVFRSLPEPVPLPSRPDHLTDIEWVGGPRLHGYTVRLVPEGHVEVVLFLQQVPYDEHFRVFVHLRSLEGEMLVQADQLPYSHFDQDLRHIAWGDGRDLRDRVVLDVPPEIDQESARLYIGLYNVVTGDRLPLVKDDSGENAVVLNAW